MAALRPHTRKGPLRGAVLALAAAALTQADDADNRYRGYTDAQLTQVASEWQTLDQETRRDLFMEVRRRMAGSGATQPIPVRGERRFGQVIRHPDGSVMRIERIIRFKTRPRERPGPAEYGKGFEQRVAEGGAELQRRPQAPPGERRVRLIAPAKSSEKPSGG